MITREEFVAICTQAILETRERITIANQLSGYLKYHKAMKEYNYFNKMRYIRELNEKKFGYSLVENYFLIEKIGIGNCGELAEYLSVEIINRLKEKNTDAIVRLVYSREVGIDHWYLNIKISLKDERKNSVWEVDAWDPRIIDASLQPDRTVKNADKLDYGSFPNLFKRTTVKEFNITQTNSQSYFQSVVPPEEGPPSRDATPEREILSKHNGGYYSDYTLERAYNMQNLNPEGKIGPLQCKSSWQ